MATLDGAPPTGDHALRRLGSRDVAALIVGIVVGTGIFKSPTLVFQQTADLGQALSVWCAGGLLSLCGALCYAELATTYPRNGGDYVYLTRAFGRRVGFLFGWAQLVAILSGSIAAMAYAFGDYAVRCLGWQENQALTLAAMSVVGISALNLLGLTAGSRAQNVLTVAKIAGLFALVAAGLRVMDAASPASISAGDVPQAPTQVNLGLALVFTLYTFGGWNDAAFVAAEVRDVNRNLPRALFVGIAGVTLIYLAVNIVIWLALGPEGARQSHAPAADVVQRALGPVGAQWVSGLVALSALGAINGMILTGARIYAAWSDDHGAFHWLKPRPNRRGAPAAAIVLQAALAAGYLFAVGTKTGRGAIDGLLQSAGLPGIAWDDFFGGFETLVAATAPVFWSFFLLTGFAVIVLRRREPERARPFRMPLYPLPVVVFIATCGYMLYASAAYAGWLAWGALALVAVGGLFRVSPAS